MVREVGFFGARTSWTDGDGDLLLSEGVGKSTIVTSLIKESFVAHVCCSHPCKRLQRRLNDMLPGPTHRSGSDNTTRGDTGERNNLHSRLWRCVIMSRARVVGCSDAQCSCSASGPLAGPQDRTHLESEIRKAHVICVVYSIDNPGSFDRIPTFWLPHFRQLGVNVRAGDCLILDWCFSGD